MYRHRITSRYIYTYSIIENKQNLNVARNLLQFDVLTRPPPLHLDYIMRTHAHTHTHTHTHSTQYNPVFFVLFDREFRKKIKNDIYLYIGWSDTLGNDI